MGSMSIWHWAVLAILWLIVGLPFWRIVKRTGLPPTLSLLMFVPLVNILVLWVIATARWPAVDRG